MPNDASPSAPASSPLAEIRKVIKHVPIIGDPPPCVPVIPLYGAIRSSTGGRFRRALNLHDYATVIEAAFKMSGAKAVALAVNSPGGSPVQSRLIHDRIRRLADEKNLKVYAFAEDVAASGGYLLSLAADEIYADESSIIGSIGVISAGFGFPELLQRFGVERRVYAEGDHKGALDPFQPEKPDDVARLRGLQKDVHESFVNLVRARRGDRLKGEPDEMFSGAFWSAPRAQEMGLIDGVAHMREFFRQKFGKTVKLKVIPTDGRGPLGRLLGARGSKTQTAAHAEMIGEWTDAALDCLENRWHWSRYGL